MSRGQTDFMMGGRVLPDRLASSPQHRFSAGFLPVVPINTGTIGTMLALTAGMMQKPDETQIVMVGRHDGHNPDETQVVLVCQPTPAQPSRNGTRSDPRGVPHEDQRRPA